MSSGNVQVTNQIILTNAGGVGPASTPILPSPPSPGDTSTETSSAPPSSSLEPYTPLTSLPTLPPPSPPPPPNPPGNAEHPPMEESEDDSEDDSDVPAMVGPGPFLTFTLAVTAVTAAFDILKDTVVALDNSFQEMVRRGSNYSGDIALASELADIRLVYAEMRRARELQDELVSFADERGRFSSELKDLNTTISKVLMPLLTSAFKEIRGSLESINKILENIPQESIDSLIVEIKSFVTSVHPELVIIPALLRYIASRLPEKPNKLDEDLKDLMKFFDPAYQVQGFGRMPIAPPQARKF